MNIHTHDLTELDQSKSLNETRFDVDKFIDETVPGLSDVLGASADYEEQEDYVADRRNSPDPGRHLKGNFRREFPGNSETRYHSHGITAWHSDNDNISPVRQRRSIRSRLDIRNHKIKNDLDRDFQDQMRSYLYETDPSDLPLQWNNLKKIAVSRQDTDMLQAA